MAENTNEEIINDELPTEETVEETVSGVTPEEMIQMEKVDDAFEKHGVTIIAVDAIPDPQKIVMNVISDMHPDADPVTVTMNFEDDIPTTLDFEGPDVYTEEEGQAVLNAVMESLVGLLSSMTSEEAPAEETAEETEQGIDDSSDEGEAAPEAQ